MKAKEVKRRLKDILQNIEKFDDEQPCTIQIYDNSGGYYTSTMECWNISVRANDNRIFITIE